MPNGGFPKKVVLLNHLFLDQIFHDINKNPCTDSVGLQKWFLDVLAAKYLTSKHGYKDHGSY